MAAENIITTADSYLRLSNIPPARLECALEASYELESLAVMFPQFSAEGHVSLPDEHIQRLFINRIKELARVVMSTLDDDRETHVRRIVGLEG